MRSKVGPDDFVGLNENGSPMFGIPPNEDIAGNEIADYVKNGVMFKDLSEVTNLREPMRINIIRLGILQNWSEKRRSMFETIFPGKKFDEEYRKWRGAKQVKHEAFIKEFRDDNLKTLRSLRGTGATQAVTVLTRGWFQNMKKKLFGR